uniref:RanBP2-type domain-containing protein n=1 Tax=Hyaloperonospora arabidopsidis (strain Emoy2) TaxID=559515 RepID=M4BK84_HYAAE
MIQPLSDSILKPVQIERCYENHDNLKAKSDGGAAPKTGWACSTCTFYNANEATVICEACNAIRIVQCPGCKGEINYWETVLTPHVLVVVDTDLVPTCRENHITRIASVVLRAIKSS